jgi:hypothetical protein
MIDDYAVSMRKIRDLAIEYLDLEFQLANGFLQEETREQYDIRQEQIHDEIKNMF